MAKKKSKKQPDSDYEIIIVGGGPAGISTWLHLHKYAPDLAARTLLIEKARYPRDKICGGGVGAWSPLILQNLQVNLDIPSIMISDVEFRYEKKTFVLHQPNSFMMVQRKEFDHSLAKAALRRGLVLHENESFIDMNRRKDTLLVKTNYGEYTVKVLVGADGALSTVRRKMNLKNTPHLATTLEFFSPVNSQFDSEYKQKKIVLDMTCQNERVQGYIWHLPCIRNNEPYMCHGIGHMRVYPEKPKPNLVTIFRRELQARDISSEIKSWSSHPIRWYAKEDNISQPHVILVGDAVGIEPAFGGGIHFALSYGDASAYSIMDAFKQNNFSFSDYNQRIQSHLIGKFIEKCMRLAQGMYNQEIDPIEVAREVFTIPKEHNV